MCLRSTKDLLFDWDSHLMRISDPCFSVSLFKVCQTSCNAATCELVKAGPVNERQYYYNGLLTMNADALTVLHVYFVYYTIATCYRSIGAALRQKYCDQHVLNTYLKEIDVAMQGILIPSAPSLQSGCFFFIIGL